MCRWTWKFYQRQVVRIVELLEKRQTNKGFRSEEEYIAVMEKMGKPINPDRLPSRIEDFPYEVQMAYHFYELSPDVWDGAGGNYFGKNYSSLGTLFDIYDVDNPKEVMIFLKYIDAFTSKKINEDISKERKRKDKSTPNVPVDLR